jgi:hypothetical protein
MDLWVTSDTWSESVVYLAPLVRRPASPRQVRLAGEFLSRLRRFGPPAQRQRDKQYVCHPPAGNAP